MNHNKQQSSDGGHDDDAALSDFLASLMDYTPTIPDELVEHFLAKTGFQSPDLRLDVLPKVNVITESLRDGAVGTQFCSLQVTTRLVAVATQKFIAEVASDALQQCKARQATVVRDKRDKQQKDKRLVLTMEDLSRALHEHGVNVKHQEYFADSPSIGMDPASRDE